MMDAATFHDRTNCAALQMCTGAKYRKITNVEKLQPCKKCARPVYTATGFADIKRILGVKDRKQIADSLGTTESLIKRNGYTMRISGLPETTTVNTIEFYFTSPVAFLEDSLFTPSFFDRLGLRFDGCRADTIRNHTPHPVTARINRDVTIEYRNCAVVERKDPYDDINRYFYRLTFMASDMERGPIVEKIQLVLDVDR